MKCRCSFFVPCTLMAGLMFVRSALGDFYVSPGGSDGGSGTIERPFSTLEKARDAVRATKQANADRPITVWLRGGDFVRTNALALSAADSGTEKAPIVWRAYGDERVR